MGRMGNGEREDGRGGAGSAEGRGELLTPNVERGGTGRKCLEAAVKLVPLGSAVRSWPAVQKTPEKAMAPHSSALAWEIPWMEEPGGLQSTGSRRVGHD